MGKTTPAFEYEPLGSIQFHSSLFALGALDFFGELNAQCDDNRSKYLSRSKSRDNELAAIEDTIHILDNDSAFKAFGLLQEMTHQIILPNAVSCVAAISA